uniref:Uncharacterized protein n=1 Tax=Erwinia amylovora ATCC BAA-2158 TaxID=889211 RepID=E5B5Z6_ERWAM|nr:hypothetical protein predicted by Glimmer/Critica [Erwinia amylovora ATCC BAA-2158]
MVSANIIDDLHHLSAAAQRLCSQASKSLINLIKVIVNLLMR